MFIVLSADIGFILQHTGLSSGGASSKAITILRAFRIMRVVKLLQRLQSIKVIIDAVINILPNISNVMSLFVLALFIYSCVGISLFAGIKMRGEGLDSKNNFQTFGGSMLILMRFATGEDWNSFMYELGKTDDCRVSNQFRLPIFFSLTKTTLTSKSSEFKVAETVFPSLTSFLSKW